MAKICLGVEKISVLQERRACLSDFCLFVHLFVCFFKTQRRDVICSRFSDISLSFAFTS